VFILSFGEDGPETDVISTGLRSFIRMAIGFDPETEVCYFLTTAIDFVESLNAHELSFWLSAEHSNGFEETLWDGSETRFIRRPDRGLIWQAILLGLRVLVTWIGPERVLMLTMRDHLPDRAVRLCRTAILCDRMRSETREQMLAYGTARVSMKFVLSDRV
jgi:hypothetical protein